MNYCICFNDRTTGRPYTKITGLPLTRIGDRVLVTLSNDDDKQLLAAVV